MDSVDLGGRSVGVGQRCFFIAEAGINHNGDVALAHALIDAAARAGADAVKFQTFTPDRLAAEGAPKAAYQRAGSTGGDQRAMLAGLVLDERSHRELQAHAHAAQITFLSSVFDEASVDLLERLEVPALKIPSGELTNHGLLGRVRSSGRPVILSTGMSTLEEVAEAVSVLGSSPLVLLHCVSSYPAAPEDCNLRALELLRTRFRVPVGWSDHTQGSAVALAAVALGACVVEKHLTLSRTLPGPDHACSLEPAELAALVADARTVEAALGKAEKVPSAAEREIAAVARKSLHWARDLEAGRSVEAGDWVALRPGTGISPLRAGAFVGRRAARAVRRGQALEEEDFE